MSSRSKSGWGAYEFTRAAFDEQRTAEITHSVWIEIRLHTTFQRGVYSLVIKSEPMLEADHHLRHAISCTFPNATYADFAATLYQEMYKLCRMLENAAQDAQRQRAKVGWHD